MSYKLVDAVINHDIGDGLAKFVLIALARFANESGQCFPSINTLCKITHLSRQTVITKIKWLCAAQPHAGPVYALYHTGQPL